MRDLDTIAAIATPSGEGGIGIIRISGPRALAVGERVFSVHGKVRGLEDRHLEYGVVTDPQDGSIIDQGFLVYMRGPRTYTGEDVVELQLHGGSLVLGQALDAVFRCGARAAGPGEFTKRAFLSGKIDLTQAEAVMDVIGASTPRGLESARARLRGALGAKAAEIREALLGVITRLEARIEFPEEMEEGQTQGGRGAGDQVSLAGGIKQVLGLVEGLLSTYREGAALREGVRVLILGRPNVGKSSLLNLLLGEKRAIVTHIPGTTRDVIEEAVVVHGIALRLMDTAGLRETADFVESLGVRAAMERIAGADVVLFVVDASVEDFTKDKGLLKGLEGKTTILVANKADKIPGREGETRARLAKEFPGLALVFISALDGSGLKGLEDALYERITGRPVFRGASGPGRGIEAPAGCLIATARQREALVRVREGLQRALDGFSFSEGLQPDLLAEALRDAGKGLRELTGEIHAEDILESIFSEFCIGK